MSLYTVHHIESLSRRLWRILQSCPRWLSDILLCLSLLFGVKSPGEAKTLCRRMPRWPWLNLTWIRSFVPPC